LAREHGLKNVLVSNGYINEGPGEEVVELLDAANIDLKGFDPGFYRNETGGKLEEVLRFLRQAAGRIHLEVTTLVIPTKNDDPSQIDGIARFIASLDPSIPLHLSCYHPQHKYTIPPTTFSTVKALAEVAKKHLHYVYLGNVGVEETNTYCPSCGNLLVRRVGYSVHLKGTHEDKCAKCGVPTGIVGAP
jgi:pyruvate formate lyase activating enzyme